jgi:hypothetical protein
MLTNPIRFGEHIEHPLRDDLRVITGAELVQQDNEFIGADPRQIGGGPIGLRG